MKRIVGILALILAFTAIFMTMVSCNDDNENNGGNTDPVYQDYTVKVVDQNGDVVEGMSIQLCPNGVCLAEKFVTDANGEITVKLNAGYSVDVKLEGLDGYVLPAPIKDSYHAVIAAGETEVTVTVTKK